MKKQPSQPPSFKMKTIDQLNEKEHVDINLRMKFIHDPETKKNVTRTSDGHNHNEGYEKQAFDWELRLWTKENLIKKYNQKDVPDWLFFLCQPTNINPENLKDITFRKAHLVDVPVYIPGETTEELAYLHPMLAHGNRFTYVDIAGIVPGKFVIVYSQIDSKNIDAHEADCINVKPAEKIAKELQSMLDFINNL